MSFGGLFTVVLLSLVAALIVESALAFLTMLTPAADDWYGAPLPLGRSCFGIPVMRCETTFSGVVFALDVAIYTAFFAILGRLSGLVGVFAGFVGCLGCLVAVPAMLGYELPVVGLPVPYWGGSPVPWVIVLWADTLIWAAAGAWLTFALRRRREPAPA